MTNISIDDYVSELEFKYSSKNIPTFEEIFNKYKNLKEEISAFESNISEFESKIRKEEIPTYEYYKKHRILISSKVISLVNDMLSNKNKDSYDFTEQVALYTMIEYLIKDNKSEEFEELGIDLHTLLSDLKSNFANLNFYIGCKETLNWKKEDMDELLKEAIDLDANWKSPCQSEYGEHLFVRMGNELKCVHCGFETLECGFKKEELDFLTACANRQGRLIKNVSEKDYPLIQVLDDIRAEEIKKNTPHRFDELFNYNEEFENDWMYYDHLKTSAQFDMQLKLNRAHLQDGKKEEMVDNHGHRVRVGVQKYLFDIKAKEMLEQVNKDIERAKALSDDVEAKQLFIEMCTVRKYEILILAGKHIPTMFNNLEDEFEKDCLAKAYYNLGKEKYRSLSDYFDKNNGQIKLKSDENLLVSEAMVYDIYTADPGVNNKILEMRIKRD